MSRSLRSWFKSTRFFLRRADGDRQCRLPILPAKTGDLFLSQRRHAGVHNRSDRVHKNHNAFTAANTEIVGVSADSVEKHEKFKTKHNLGVTLLSDPDQKMLYAYGVWVEKNMYGRNIWALNGDVPCRRRGKILNIWRKSSCEGPCRRCAGGCRRVSGHANSCRRIARKGLHE